MTVTDSALRPLTPLLDSIEGPAEIKALKTNQRIQLAAELRHYLLWSVQQSGGHFGAGLGVIELTIALHSILNLPEDRLVWDVGHQAYPHKVLTGRRDALTSIRTSQGLTPFPTREESLFDAFGVGHSSTSISAALGMAIASQRQGKAHQHVAVIGDGALTAGMAFEALNHAAQTGASMTVILNDNDMSISPNVGSLATYLDSSQAGDLFTSLGFSYHGPLDGHDLQTLPDTLADIIQRPGMKLVHVQTIKGKGYPPAEADPVGFHALAKVEPKEAKQNTPQGKKFSRIFSDWICDTAANDDRLLAITPAMREGSDLVRFSERYPERYFDVGIAEQHAVTLAAGMACEGAKPVVAIYSTFLQRGYDQLVHDVALQNLDVLLAVDRAGLVGEDGPTHSGVFDISFSRCLPNLAILCPSDEQETYLALNAGYQHKGPAIVRYPRGAGRGAKVDATAASWEFGKACIGHLGQRSQAVLAFGPVVHTLLPLCEDLDITLVDMRFVAPLDESLLDSLHTRITHFITVEEHQIAGGAGSAVAEYLARQSYEGKVEHWGIEHRYIPHGSQEEQRQWCALDSESLKHKLKALP
ncbi:1-deoxy-D-xylulose-5-phosphate synthase [Pokkaliibacter sp. CJK22405]|uniref:1-deoxy-D-xylulose-5-phosphate synthase n=1 Tax=Pokkaliibacter sp. CJK22405 TaxID=3384615 RepID=UPI00398568F7